MTINPYHRPKLTDDQKTQAVILWRLGYGAAKISQKIGCFQSPVNEHFKKLGLTRTKAEMVALRKKNQITYTEDIYAKKKPTAN